MNDKHPNTDFDQAFDYLFDNAIPEADKKGKSDSIENAMDVFSQEVAQGTHNTARPTTEPVTETWLTLIVKPIWSLFMNIPTNRMAYGTFGTLAVAFIAISLFYVAPPTPANRSTVITQRIDESSVVPPMEHQPNGIIKGNEEVGGKDKVLDDPIVDTGTSHDTLEEIGCVR